LNASASSDADGDALIYRWSLTSVPTGSASSLLGADTLQPTFTPDIDGEYIAQLIVNDGEVDSLADKVTITSSTANAAPVANAGSDQNVAVMTVVTLDGSASTDADADQLSYVWRLVTIPMGSNAALNLTNTASPRFTADVAGDYIVELVVNDGTVDSAPDTVTVIASTTNSAPIANAGADQNVSTLSVVTLNGNGSSDVDGDVLTYAWSFASLPAGSSASLSGANEVSATFTVDLDGVYVVQLIVNDGEVNSVADTITVTANTANSAPVANAGDDQSVGVGDTVFLNGNASSDADNDGLAYLWSFVARPTGSLATFDDPSAVNPSFVADNEGSYVINLVVNDGTDSSAADVVTVDAVTPTIRLFQESRLTEGTFNEITFPYNSAVVLNANVTGIPAPTTLTVGTFKLSAEAGDFTIINLTATDGTSQVVPFFDGITDSFVVEAGTEVQFGLVSPLTGGVPVTLTFSFEIQETGDTFRARFTFTSN
jgi:predicted aspartyl protease